MRCHVVGSAEGWFGDELGKERLRLVLQAQEYHIRSLV